MNLLQTASELIVGFVALLIMLKLLGKATLAQITPFDFISALILGDLIGNAIYEEEARIGSILFSISVWGGLIYLLEWTTQKYRGTRSILEGKPSIIVRDGQLDRLELKKNKLDINQLQQLLRRVNVFSIRNIAYAILETDGTVSVLQKSTYATPTNADLHVPEKQVSLPISFITDGKVEWDNLSQAGFDERWLLSRLQERNIYNYYDVLYMDWQKEEGIHIQKNT
ncbi:DUF421 domain-containing protein [Geomicrobium sp. JSM 1781026]|uniref:DUF421 domain-containing protein n=1 Tax=Geomicrobium sp. JSM 1781026 TaxID=3344580 RepID=UPI0035BF3A0B